MSHSPDHNPNPISSTDLTETMDIDTARQVEDAKISRRAALRKLGFGAGMAAFAMLGVDDFARMVGKRMERMAGDDKVAGQIAQEFRSAGIALADNPSGAPCVSNSDCSGCASDSIAACCVGSSDPFTCCAKSSDQTKCCSGVTGVGKYQGDPEANDECNAVPKP